MTSIPISIRRSFAWIALATLSGASLAVIWTVLRPSQPRSPVVRSVPRDPRAVEGRVVWADGRPAAGARVLMNPLQPNQGVSETVADEAGVSRFVGVPNWTYAITARMLDSHDPLRDRAIGHLEPVAASAPRVDVELARLMPIRGTVVDTSNQPVKGVHVQVTGSSPLVPFLHKYGFETEDDGRFEVWAPEGEQASLEAVRQTRVYDMGTIVGPTVRLEGVLPGTEAIVVRMPDER